MSANTDFVQSIIGSLSGTLGNVWDSNVSQLVVNDSVEAYGVTNEADATDSVKLHALLRYFTWVRVQDALLLVATPDDRITKRVEQERKNAFPYLGNFQLKVGRISFPDDPYSINGQIRHNA